jgi:hypothetical protein
LKEPEMKIEKRPAIQLIVVKKPAISPVIVRG